MKAPLEDYESMCFARWLDTQTELLHTHIPNETPTSIQAAMRLKAKGVRRGVPDHVIVHKATGDTLWIEMKRTKGGAVSKDQKKWLAALPNAIVCRGYREARNAVEHWQRSRSRVRRDT